MPVEWEQIDSWIRPKILEAMPALVKDWVAARGRQGKVDETHIVLYYAIKVCGPGSCEEKVQLSNDILNPNVCSQPRAAQLELMRWKEKSGVVMN